MKTVVKVEDILAAQEVLTQVNKLKLEDIEWTVKGIPIYVNPDSVKDFKFIGLSNVNFITMDFYKGWNDDKQ